MSAHFVIAMEMWQYKTSDRIFKYEFYTTVLMLKILQPRLQQYMNRELPDIQAGFRKGRGTIDLIANIFCIIKKRREFQKIIYFCFIDYAKAFNCVDHHKLWKILQEMGIPVPSYDRLAEMLKDKRKAPWT